MLLTQNDFVEAMTLYKRARSIQEKALGLDHLELAPTLNNMAVVFETQVRVLYIWLIELVLEVCS